MGAKASESVVVVCFCIASESVKRRNPPELALGICQSQGVLPLLAMNSPA
jgi:hypothetical protein